MFKKMLFVLLLMAVAVSSACTGGGEGAYSQTEGLVITNFEAIPSGIYNDEQVTLALEVLNKGGPGIIAKDAKAFILNMNLGGWQYTGAEWVDIQTGTSSTPTPQQQQQAPSATPATHRVAANTDLPVNIYSDSYHGRKSIRFYYGSTLVNNTQGQNVTDCPASVYPCTATLRMPEEDRALRVVVYRYQDAVQDNVGSTVFERTTQLDVLASSASNLVSSITIREETAQQAPSTSTPTPTPTSTNAVLLAWDAGDIYGASKDGTLKAIPDGTTWNIKAANNLARTLDVNFNPKVRLCYNYKTEATTMAKAIRLDELRSQQQRGNVEETDISTKNSGGPIQMKITTRQPIVVRNNEANKLKLTVDISNVDPVAGGLAYTPADDKSCLNPGSGRNKILVAVEVVGANCAPTVGRLDLRNKPADMSQAFFNFYTQSGVPQQACLNFVTLSDGKKAVANYEFDLTDAIVGEKELTVRLTAFYGYYTEAETRFSVSPLPE